jgi:hypothetical protein
VLVVTALMLLGSVAAGCGAPPPPAAQVLESGAQLLTEVSIKGVKGVLAQTASGELMVTIWQAGGSKDAIRGGSPESSRPLVGWAQGLQAIAGRFPGEQGARVAVETESGTVAGKLERGAYLVVWPAPKATGLFVLRIYDAQGKELFRWAPTSGPAAA